MGFDSPAGGWKRHEMRFIGGDNSGAIFSPDRVYRYSLWRRWTPDARVANMCCFIGLNPSTADELVDDPTIRRCIGFSKAWGYDGYIMLNIFGFRATKPKDMKACDEPIGPQNNDAIWQVSRDAGRVVAAWGAHGMHQDRAFDVRAILRRCRQEVFCLGRTSGGHPLHPLYIKADTEPIRYL